MGTDQGKLGNMHALGIIADTAGVKMGELGTTTFRPPYTPLTFGTIVGRNVGEYFDIFRRTPMNDWHIKIKLNLKMLVNGKELGITQKIMKLCMKQFKEKVKLQEKVLEY
jgi:hypothetical protein